MTLNTISTADLTAELARRQKGAAKLEERRAKLLAELTGIENELRGLGMLDGKPTRARGKDTRPKNAVSLPAALADAAEVGAVLTPAEAAELVIANGYVTAGKRFGVQVATALAKHEGFKRVGRGQYERVG